MVCWYTVARVLLHIGKGAKANPTSKAAPNASADLPKSTSSTSFLAGPSSSFCHIKLNKVYTNRMFESSAPKTPARHNIIAVNPLTMKANLLPKIATLIRPPSVSVEMERNKF
jgi:hypothetical protein